MCVSLRHTSLTIYLFHLIPSDQYTRHKILINEYTLNHAGATARLQRDTSGRRSDYDILAENHRFLWESEDEDDGDSSDARRSLQQDWGRRLAKKYYDSLFREFAICDLSRYTENKVAMRWRTEGEVIEGRGQLTCGEKRCSQSCDLKTWEVNFRYEEQGVSKNALVKLRLCPACSSMLNWKEKRKQVKRKKHKKRKKSRRDVHHKKERKEERERESSSSSSSSSPSDASSGEGEERRDSQAATSSGDAAERFLQRLCKDVMMA